MSRQVLQNHDEVFGFYNCTGMNYEMNNNKIKQTEVMDS